MGQQVLYCRCGVPITVPLDRTTALLSALDGQPLVPDGNLYRVEGGFDAWTARPGDWLVNKADLRNCRDGGVRNGCCGVDGQDGLNIFCSQGHDVGTEVSDCWTPHFVLIDQSKIRTKKPSWL